MVRYLVFAIFCLVLVGLAACTAVWMGDDSHWAGVPCNLFDFVTGCGI